MGQGATYRSKLRYLHLAVMLVVVLLIALFSRSFGESAIAAGIGLTLLGVSWRGGIYATANGIEIRRLMGTVRLCWTQVESFEVVTTSPTSRPLLFRNMWDASTAPAVSQRTNTSWSVAVITDTGERIRVLGTASTIFDRDFPSRAAAALNAELKQRNSSATGATGLK